jgi:hypothetical protein
MEDHGTGFSGDVDPNFDAKARPQQGPTVEITVGNRESDPPFSCFGPARGGGGGVYDSRLAGKRETGNPRFPTRPGPGMGVPGAAGLGFPGLGLSCGGTSGSSSRWQGSAR